MNARRLLVFSLFVCFATTSATAQEWARKMFETHDHNFETVARGSDTVYKFRFKNIYKEDVHIASVRSSCGCTDPSIENDLLKTYEEGYIVAKFNTKTMTGYHSATLTVEIDKPYRAQVQLHVHGNIRGDVVFEPGSVVFDTVDQGTKFEKRVSVRYAGRSGWKIDDVVVASETSDHIEVELAESERVGGRVRYDLLVRLKETAPAGFLKDQLILVTNDGRNPRIPLDVEGRIVPEISVAPENLVFGDIDQASEMTKKIVVRGKKPFTITAINGGGDSLSFNHGSDEKTTHIVEVTLRAPSQAGRLKQPITISTSLGESYAVVCNAYANVQASPPIEPAADETVAEAPDTTDKPTGLATDNN
jgi:hypothetical protein